MSNQQKYQWRLVGLKELLQEQIISKTQFDRKCYENQIRFLGSGDDYQKLIAEAISQSSNLRHVETLDKSHPHIDPSVHLKKDVRPDVLRELQGGHNLRHVETMDRSTPHIDPSAHISEAPQKKVFEELKTGKATFDHKRLMKELGSSNPNLKRADTHDRSDPIIEPGLKVGKNYHSNLMDEILHGNRELSSVVTYDRSNPYIDPAVHISDAPQKNVFGEIKSGKAVVDHKRLMKELGNSNPSLKHVHTRDTSTPHIEEDFHLRMSAYPVLFRELQTGHDLRSVQTNDRSAPYIDPLSHIAEAPHKKIFEELMAGKVAFDQRKVLKDLSTSSPQLKHVETVDRSVPYIDPHAHINPSHRPDLYRELLSERELKHVQTLDRSVPYIDPGIHIGQAPHKKILEELATGKAVFDQRKLLKELDAGAPSLKHVETVDRSSPYIEPNLHINPSHRPDLYREIQNAHELRHVETSDRSAPYIDPNVQLREAVQKHLFEELRHARTEWDRQRLLRDISLLANPQLTHVETVDRSAPYIDPNAQIQLSGRPLLFRELQTRNPENLRSVDTVDRSAPYLDPNVHIRPAPHRNVLDQLAAGKHVFDQRKVLRELSGQHAPLRHVEVHDTSSPYIDPNVHIREAPHKKIFEEISHYSEHPQLRHVEVHDTSSPYIDPNAHIGEAPHKKVFEELKAGKAVVDQRRLVRELSAGTHPSLRHIETVDRSSPYIEPDVHIGQSIHPELMREILRRPDLHSVISHDRSSPYIDPDSHISESHQKRLLQELLAGKSAFHQKRLLQELGLYSPESLHHVETVDRSVPVIDPSVHIGEAPQKKVFEEISHPPTLKHVETADKSAPLIDPDAHIGEAPHKKVFEELKSAKPVYDHRQVVKEIPNHPELKHTETVDKSAPIIDPESHIGEAPQKKVFEEISHPHNLKHVDTVDKSAPVIDPETHIGEAPHKKVFEEIKSKNVDSEKSNQ